MEVLSKVTDEGRKRCKELLDKDICKVELLDTPVVLHIIIEMEAGEDSVSLEIKYDHINVTKIIKNKEGSFLMRIRLRKKKKRQTAHCWIWRISGNSQIQWIFRMSENFWIPRFEATWLLPMKE